MHVQSGFHSELGSPTSRPDRTSTYLRMAEVLAKRSTCKRASVGCIIADQQGLVLATGYNGVPTGMPHCIDSDCLMAEGHCISTLHAEMNAMARFISAGSYLTCYCTHAPCLACMKVGVTKGIMIWYYQTHYDDSYRDRFIQWYNLNRKLNQPAIQIYQVLEKDLERHSTLG